MRFTFLPQLEHELVALRPLRPDDIPAWFAYLSRPEVYEHTNWNVKQALESWSMKTRYELWAILLALCCASLPSIALDRGKSRQLIKSISGNYRNSVGCLTISSKSGMQIEFTTFLWGSGDPGYSCTIEGKARLIREDVFEFVLPEDDESVPRDCKFRMRVTAGSIEFEDVGNACRRYFCGRKASLEASFFEAERVRKKCIPR